MNPYDLSSGNRLAVLRKARQLLPKIGANPYTGRRPKWRGKIHTKDCDCGLCDHLRPWNGEVKP